MDSFNSTMTTCYKGVLSFNETDKYDPHILCINIGAKELSAWAKNYLSQEEKENFKNCLFYPIAIERKKDMSFDITFGCLK